MERKCYQHMLNIEPTSENGSIRIPVGYKYNMNYNICVCFSFSWQFSNLAETSFHPHGSILNAVTPGELSLSLPSIGSSYVLLDALLLILRSPI